MTATTSTSTPRPATAAGAFAGTLLIVAPHMDDEVLACGGLVASHPGKAAIYMVFATDGMRSPAPVLPWRDAITPDLGALRENESRAAAAELGVPVANLRFLRLPEAELTHHRPKLGRLLADHIREIDPDHILIPFRYDRHPDHIAVNHAVMALRQKGQIHAQVSEYFVYYRSRLLPRGDIREYVRQEHLLHLDISRVAARKRSALDRFVTQTTRFYPWQTRPILRPELLDEECVGPEMFLRYDPAFPGPKIFTGPTWWIRIAHRLEPRIVRWKYLVRSSVLRAVGRDA